MACLASDGSLTPVAAQVLGALAAAEPPGAADAVASATGLPVYRVRATLRELQLAHLIEERDGNRVLTPTGRAKLDAATGAPSPAPDSAPVSTPQSGAMQWHAERHDASRSTL